MPPKNQTILHTEIPTATSELTYPLYAVTLGVRQFQQPIVRPTGFLLHQVFYCTGGRGILQIGNDSFSISEGYGFYLAPDSVHSYRAAEGDWEVSYLGFTGAISRPLMQSLGLEGSCAFRLGNGDGFLSALQQIADLTDTEFAPDRQVLSLLTYRCLLELAVGRNRVLPHAGAEGDPYVEQIVNYLQNHYTQPVSLDAIAHEIGLTKEYMCSYFKKHMHKTIFATLTDIRIMNACALLNLHPEKRVAEIANMCGFESASYFGSAFKKHQGMTPDAYRKRN